MLRRTAERCGNIAVQICTANVVSAHRGTTSRLIPRPAWSWSDTHRPRPESASARDRTLGVISTPAGRRAAVQSAAGKLISQQPSRLERQLHLAATKIATTGAQTA